jgi:hypothetical protein
MDAATLPGRVHNFCDRGFDAFGSVRDNELDAAQAATPKLAQPIQKVSASERPMSMPSTSPSI